MFEDLAFIIEVLPIVHEHLFWIPERENLKKKQDHQRWGYSTVTHIEQPVFLTVSERELVGRDGCPSPYSCYTRLGGRGWKVWPGVFSSLKTKLD